MNTRTLRFVDNGFVLFLLAASLCLNVYLWRVIRADGGQPSLDTLAVGSVVPPLPVADLNGDATVITWASDSRPTIVYVFSPSCIWCSRNLENVAQLIRATKNTHRFIAVSISGEGLSDYVSKNHFEVPVYLESDIKTLQQFKFNVTPTTLEISPEGKVLHSWAGAYGGTTRNEIEEAFNVRLSSGAPAGFSSY